MIHSKLRAGNNAMFRVLRILATIVPVALALSSAGCESLGFTPPANKLLPDAKAIRNSAPVPAPVPRELAKELFSSYVVEPGDVLLVQPADLDAPVRLPPDQTVLADGTIDLGIYGRPVVAGKTQELITADVKQLINAKEKPKDPIAITVRLIGRNSQVFYVLGEVNAPGAFPITGFDTVLDGIIKAGGVTRRASEQNIVMSRPTLPEGCRLVYPVCYPQIVQLGDTSTNYQLQPGDRIYVPSRGMLEGLLPQRCKRGGVCDRPQIGCWNGECGSSGGSCGGPSVAIPPAPTSAPHSLPAELSHR
jgi:polysaccharide biosynthesis/export protein